MSRSRLAIALVVVALASAAPAQEGAPPRPPPLLVVAEDGPLRVTLTIDPAAPQIGESVYVALTAAIDGAPSDPGVRDDRVVRWPELGPALLEALGEDVLEVEEVRRAADGRSVAATLRLYDAGRFELPPLAAELRRAGVAGEGDPLARVELAGAALEIASTLPEDAEPAAARDALAWEPDVPLGPLPWFLGAGLLAAALLLVWWIRRGRAAAAVPPPPVYVPPHERALRALGALLDQRLPQQGAVEPYFVQLSEILRRYLEDRFGLRAPEQTTEEFLAQVTSTAEGRRAVDEAHRELLRDFLTRADLVKFACATPDLGDCERAAGSARRFVEDTAPVRALPEEAA